MMSFIITYYSTSSSINLEPTIEIVNYFESGESPMNKKRVVDVLGE